MYVFYGKPLEYVNSRQSGKVIFRFDSKGEYYTNDPQFIERAIGNFDYAEIKVDGIGERIKKTVSVPPLIITVQGEETKDETKEEQFLCKYCGEPFESAGKRQAHYMHGCPKKE